jgi:hypothetical protein
MSDYLGAAIRVTHSRVDGYIGTEARGFVGIGEGAHFKHQLRAGDHVSGAALPVVDLRLETVEFYKISGMRVVERGSHEETSTSPWRGVPPPLLVYCERGPSACRYGVPSVCSTS